MARAPSLDDASPARDRDPDARDRAAPDRAAPDRAAPDRDAPDRDAPADDRDDAPADDATELAIGAPFADQTTETAAEPRARARPRPRPTPGTTFGPAARIDRFVIVEKLGEGGQGSVFAAYDTLLDRKVAVKVVRPDRRTPQGGIAPRDRLLREAQAMARLSHPNVVSVLEVGELGDDVYVALEYVDGTTLKRWLRERPRPWREIVAAFAQAGRGLAAAHAAGLVHRDFKPDNVLIRKDGRIQVTDFGVVSMGGAALAAAGATPPSTPVPRDTPLTGELTFAGMRVGTPAYMAPEQHAAAAVDARADQFAFCVSLWEALYGARPFGAGDGDAALAAARTARIAPPPRDAGVPRWLEAPLRRGLAAAPVDRWPSMDELLAAIARDPAASRRRALALGAGAAVVVAAGVVAWLGWARREAGPPPCAGADEHLRGRWDAARADQVRRAFAATQLPFAGDAAARVVDRLDAWSHRWVAMRTTACTATRVTGEQSEALLDARMRCLDRELDRVDALARALAGADRDGVVRAAFATAQLPPVEACADTDALTAAVPPPADPALRRQVAALERRLATIAALEDTGRYHVAREQARAAADDAAALGFAPVTAEALLLRGRLEDQDGDLAAARATLGDAARAAGAARDDATAARALVELVEVLDGQARGAEALALSVAAAAAVARTGDRPLAAALAEQIGAADQATGDLAGAEARWKEALAAHEALEGPSSVQVAQVLNKLGGLHEQEGAEAAARAEYERALRITTAELGRDHPATAVTHANLCFLDAEAGRLADAHACQADVVATLERALGPDHPQVAWAENDLGLVERDQGDAAGAAKRFARALAIWEKASGPDHPDVAWPLINLGELALARGDADAAAASCRRALDVIARADGPDHPDTAAPAACLGEALLARAPADALPLLRRAVRALDAAPRDAMTDAAARFALARALDATRDRAGAIDAARAAATRLAAERAPAAVDQHARIAAWLAARGATP